MSNLRIEDFDVNISLDAISPSMLWESRFIEFEKTLNSQRIYESMSSDHRKALAERVKRATAVMYDTVDDWLPDGINLSDDGTCISIEFNLVLAKIDIDVENKNRATTFKLLEVKREIESLLQDEEQNEA
jgi:hypothetical protein